MSYNTVLNMINEKKELLKEKIYVTCDENDKNIDSIFIDLKQILNNIVQKKYKEIIKYIRTKNNKNYYEEKNENNYTFHTYL
jgi:DNA polymerase IIIc chi subunit